MKALEKDRSRRYETADGLARDVERYLRDEPVAACPPSAAYRMRKLVRRHRVAVFAALTFVAILMALIAGLTVTNRIITKSRNETAAALRLKEQALREAQAERRRTEANFLKARVAIDQLLTKPALGGGGQRADEQLPASFRKKLVEVATNFYTSLGEEHSPDSSSRFDAAVGQRSLAFVYHQTGDQKRSEALLRRSIGTLQALHREHPDRPEYRRQLGWSRYMLSETLDHQHRSAEALVVAEEAREIYERLIAENPQATSYRGDVWWVYGWLASMHAAAGRMEDAADMYSRRVRINPAAHSSWYDAAGFYLFMDDVERYRGACREMLDRFEKRAEQDAGIASLTARTCALIPDAVVDFSRVERLSKRSLTGTGKDPFYGDYVLTGALIDYRGKRYAQVVDSLSRHTKPDGNVAHATAFAILAMAHHRLGHADQAQASLQSARAIIGTTPPDSSEWQHCQILLRQAEQLLAERKEPST
jgi:tetratricopeptide (TPR) repeat protein